MKTIVTKTGFESLKEKLSKKIEEIKQLREEKAHAYSASGDGWHDNPGWIQLGQQEEMLSNEISKLQQKITTAVIIDSSKIDGGKVQIGCEVEFLITRRAANNQQVQKISIVGNGESDIKNKRISFDSPMGSALCNMIIGEEKEVELPGGTVIIKIQSINCE